MRTLGNVGFLLVSVTRFEVCKLGAEVLQTGFSGMECLVQFDVDEHVDHLLASLFPCFFEGGTLGDLVDEGRCQQVLHGTLGSRLLVALHAGGESAFQTAHQIGERGLAFGRDDVAAGFDHQCLGHFLDDGVALTFASEHLGQRADGGLLRRHTAH